MKTLARAVEIADTHTKEQLIPVLEAAILRELNYRRRGVMAIAVVIAAGLALSFWLGPFLGAFDLTLIALLGLSLYAFLVMRAPAASGVDAVIMALGIVKKRENERRANRPPGAFDDDQPLT